MRRLLLSMTAILLIGVGYLTAEEGENFWKIKSEKAVAAKVKYDNGVKETQRKYEEEMKKIKQALIQELEQAAIDEGKMGNLDEAIKIRTAKEHLMITTLSDETTSEDVPLKFVLEKSEWDNDDTTYIWGKVVNNSSQNYKEVHVIMSASDDAGKLLDRHTWNCSPNKIGAGQIGYIERCWVESKKKPAKIAFKVIGAFEDE